MSMRQRQSSLPADDDEEEQQQQTTTKSSTTTSRRKKRRSKYAQASAQQKKLLLGGGIAIATLLVVLFKKRSSFSSVTYSPPSRRPLFQPELGPSTKCQKHLLLSREKLDKSVALGTTFLLHHQTNEGNFDYQYDWMTGDLDNDDAEVRQAGALWGLSLIFHDMMDSTTTTPLSPKASVVLHTIASRILKGIDFWKRNSVVYSSDDDTTNNNNNNMRMRHVTYPGETKHDTGTQALVCLSLIDFLRGLSTPQEAARAGVSAQQLQDTFQLLDELLAFLVTQHSQALQTYTHRFPAYQALQESGHEVQSSGLWFGVAPEDMKSWWEVHTGPWLYGYFFDKYNTHGTQSGKSSPYYDGESLLAITKAAKYLGGRYVHLWPMATATAQSLHKIHVVDALAEDEDSDETKGVYQWLSMSLFELATVTFGEGYSTKFDLPLSIESMYPQEEFGTWLVEMAMWMVNVHRTLRKQRNTGYAYEGIVPAWTWASHIVSSTENEELVATARKLSCTMEKGISKLISWQVGMGAEQNAEEWDGHVGLGGVQNAADEPGLRIDVTQHQMHAEILTRRFVYTALGGEKEWPWEDVELLSST